MSQPDIERWLRDLGDGRTELVLDLIEGRCRGGSQE